MNIKNKTNIFNINYNKLYNNLKKIEFLHVHERYLHTKFWTFYLNLTKTLKCECLRDYVWLLYQKFCTFYFIMKKVMWQPSKKKTKFYNNFIVEYEFLSDNVWHWHTIFELSISVLKK